MALPVEEVVAEEAEEEDSLALIQQKDYRISSQHLSHQDLSSTNMALMDAVRTDIPLILEGENLNFSILVYLMNVKDSLHEMA